MTMISRYAHVEDIPQCCSGASSTQWHTVGIREQLCLPAAAQPCTTSPAPSRHLARKGHPDTDQSICTQAQAEPYCPWSPKSQPRRPPLQPPCLGSTPSRLSASQMCTTNWTINALSSGWHKKCCQGYRLHWRRITQTWQRRFSWPWWRRCRSCQRHPASALQSPTRDVRSKSSLPMMHTQPISQVAGWTECSQAGVSHPGPQVCMQQPCDKLHAVRQTAPI